MQFRDRSDAGHRLAAELARLELADPVVLALPRGGVPVALPVARRLGAPLEVFVARKVGAPGHEEYGVGAVAEGGAVVADEHALATLGIARAEFDELAARAEAELARRVDSYRGGRPLPDLAGRDVVLVDDGLATGVTAEASLVALRRLRPRTLVLAVPVCAPDTARRLTSLADRVLCLHAPPGFRAVGLWYEDFGQTTDAEVLDLLAAAGPPEEAEVALAVEGGMQVRADLAVPSRPAGLVVFAHGSGSSRRSPRNRQVAAVLHRHGLATLLADLLTDDEAAEDRVSGRWRFDVALLAGRVVAAVDHARADPRLGDLPLGCFGASTGAAAALVAAARRPEAVAAVVSRGGRPDLAGDALAAVRAPVLLIVGGADREVLRLNEQAAARLADCRLAVVPGAGHLFEDPGALARVADLAARFLDEHLTAAAAARR